MRPGIVLVACALVFGGCVTQSYQRPDAPIPLARGSIESFAPLVPSSTGTPRCESAARAPVQPGGRAVALVYPSPSAQQVTVTLDRDGVPTKYLDVRGDLSEAAPDGDRTTIGLYLTEGYAVLSNRPESGDPAVLEVPLEEALSSDRLGNPDAKLREVLTVCAATVRRDPQGGRRP